MKDGLRNPTVLAILAALTAFVFVPAITGRWIFDDQPLIQNNEYVHTFAHWPRWFVRDFWSINEEFVRFEPRIIYWRPLVSFSYALDWKLSGGSPGWFHFTNLVWQAIAGALSFIVLRRWLGGSVLAAFAAAVVFCVHPTKAESVAWISGRTDVFCLIAILLACEGVARRHAGKRGGLVLEVLGTVVAYTCKEQAIVLPAFVAIETWVARGRPAIDRNAVLQMVRAALPQLAVAIAYLVLRRAFLPLDAGRGGGHLPIVDHGLVVAESMGRFIALTFAPHDLSVQQGLLLFENGEPVRSMPHIVLGIVGTLGLIAGAVAARKKHPIVTIGIVFYLATLSPTANIVYAEMRTLISERFLYLPLFGLALVVGWAFDRFPSRAVRALIVTVALALSVQSLLRSADYRDEQSFWERELALHPKSRQARTIVIRSLLRRHEFSAAMREVMQLTEVTIGDRIEYAYLSVQVMAGLVPDHDRVSLTALDNFCRDVFEAKGPVTLAVRELRYTIATGSKLYRDELPRFKSRFLSLRADLASRLGDDERAVSYAKAVLADCPRCVGIGSLAALAIARAGHYDDSLAALDQLGGDKAVEGMRRMVNGAIAARDQALTTSGPAQLQARASELAALELWGRAYDVLAPYKDQIKTAPKAVMGFAELAVRAGEPQVAREVLAGQVSPAEIDAHVEEWSRTMGWR